MDVCYLKFKFYCTYGCQFIESLCQSFSSHFQGGLSFSALDVAHSIFASVAFRYRVQPCTMSTRADTTSNHNANSTNKTIRSEAACSGGCTSADKGMLSPLASAMPQRKLDVHVCACILVLRLVHTTMLVGVLFWFIRSSDADAPYIRVNHDGP
ncbi:hypothetical protein OG21DRAFT_847800 [Imleria badia]|nr:hypothetical protein OG21DRAFT_847800 [Imleria badia]